MEITPQIGDAPEFVQRAEDAVNGILRLHLPEALLLIKTDNWFGFKWLGFSGRKFIGRFARLPVWHLRQYRLTKEIRIPPFVPERILSQRRFAAPDYNETDAGEAIHKRVRSGLAIRRTASTEAPKTAFVWYSGNSAANERGALMAYIPVEESYWAWYAAFESGKTWKLGKTLLVDPEWFEQLSHCGRQSASKV
jgi:hypothetical protein